MYKLHLEGEGQYGRSELAYKIPHNDNEWWYYTIAYYLGRARYDVKNNSTPNTTTTIIS